MCDDFIGENEALPDDMSALREARRVSGLPLDLWVDLTDGLDPGVVAVLCERAELFASLTSPASED